MAVLGQLGQKVHDSIYPMAECGVLLSFQLHGEAQIGGLLSRLTWQRIGGMPIVVESLPTKHKVPSTTHTHKSYQITLFMERKPV
jgi:hypothetical protein